MSSAHSRSFHHGNLQMRHACSLLYLYASDAKRCQVIPQPAALAHAKTHSDHDCSSPKQFKHLAQRRLSW